jgi:hypothetical protein
MTLNKTEHHAGRIAESSASRNLHCVKLHVVEHGVNGVVCLLFKKKASGPEAELSDAQEIRSALEHL